MKIPTNLADDRQSLTRGEEGRIPLHPLMHPTVNYDADSSQTTDSSVQSVGARGRA
jgi:hypothetical protein